METLEFATKFLSVVTALFTVVVSVYHFYKWLARKKHKAQDAPVVLEAVEAVRVVPEPRAAGASVWPWLLSGALVLAFVGFFAVAGLTVIVGVAVSASKARPQLDQMEVADHKQTPAGNRTGNWMDQKQTPAVNLTGNWTEYPGTPVTIVQNGNRVTLSVLGMWTLSGTVEELVDSPYVGCLTVSNTNVSAIYYLTRDGQLEGSVNNGFTNGRSVLFRQEK